tara:strand:+ start:1076 stop:1300 length:225 start_codon:yes stop_codon:yes gene_type:complete
MKKIVHDIPTNTISAVDLTEEEKTFISNDVKQRQAQDKIEQDAVDAVNALKSSAKAKLVAGEALTEEEADTIVL